MEETLAWLRLWRTPGIGPAAFRQLLKHFGSAAAVVDRGPARAAREIGLRQQVGDADAEGAERDLAWATGDHCNLLLETDPRYPRLLAGIDSAPPLLFVRGDPNLLNTPQLAVVGSRNPTSDGMDTAFDFARHLAGAGLTVTSGLALGIDGAAHRGALEAGHTIAVLGTGPDRVYPARHRDLAHAIVAGGGALVSEFPTGTEPLAANFPQRNRIISGLALGTLVVEAALRSGSLVTARLAADQGREVFAIPGSIHSPLARGCHRLIRQGAKLVEAAGDLLEELAPQLLPYLEPEPGGTSIEAPDDALDPEYAELLSHVGFQPVTVDTLVERSGLTAEVVSSMLLLLELQGVIVSAPGGRYSLAKRV